MRASRHQLSVHIAAASTNQAGTCLRQGKKQSMLRCYMSMPGLCVLISAVLLVKTVPLICTFSTVSRSMAPPLAAQHTYMTSSIP